jgi:hypothetical protein
VLIGIWGDGRRSLEGFWVGMETRQLAVETHIVRKKTF